MPSEIGYSLPPISQRPQQFGRVEATDQKNLNRVKEDEPLQRSGVELTKAKAVNETREVLDDRFPRETQVDRFRGNTEGRSLSAASGGESITRLPDRVQAFSPLTARSGDVSSLSIAESAALGITQPSILSETSGESAETGPVIGRAADQSSEIEESSSSDQAQAQGIDAATQFPAINGSGEIAARFEAIAERREQRSNDEFSGLRPGGSASELIADERIQDQVRADVVENNQQSTRQNEDLARIVRRQDQVRQDEQVVADRADQNVIDAQVSSQASQAQPATQSAQTAERDQSDDSNRSSQASQPGEPTNSSGEPLSSEEQKEITRLERRDREVRSHE
jgi:hypothetical protein